MTTLEVLLLCASINCFVLVNLDRLLTLKFPLTYNNKSPASFKIIKIGIAISCLLAIIPAVPMWVPDVYNTRTHQQGNISVPLDGSGAICSLPYESVGVDNSGWSGQSHKYKYE